MSESSFHLVPFSVHEAEIALFHAWSDGHPIQGPMDRHLESGLIARFRAGLKIGMSGEGERMTAFGDWRINGRTRGRIWSIETSAPLGALSDADGELLCLPELGEPMIMMIRFLCEASGRWRVHQFHDVELATTDAADANEIMMSGFRFRAGWQEYFGGLLANTPDLTPILVGTIEWHHQGRTIPCWHYDHTSDTWTETDENSTGSGDGLARYVSLEFDEDQNVAISYLTPKTQTFPSGSHQQTGLQWIDARAFQVISSPSSSLTMEPGWTLQTAGCPEPITIPPSGRHWTHPVVRIRHLNRLYATFAHGVVAIPKMITAPALDAPFDFPIRLGSLTLLPHLGYLTPAS